MKNRSNKLLVPVTLALGILTTAFVATGSTVATPAPSEGAGAGPATEPPPTTSVQTAVNSATTAATTAAGGYTEPEPTY